MDRQVHQVWPALLMVTLAMGDNAAYVASMGIIYGSAAFVLWCLTRRR